MEKYDVTKQNSYVFLIFSKRSIANRPHLHVLRVRKYYLAGADRESKSNATRTTFTELEIESFRFRQCFRQFGDCESGLKTLVSSIGDKYLKLTYLHKKRVRPCAKFLLFRQVEKKKKTVQILSA